MCTNWKMIKDVTMARCFGGAKSNKELLLIWIPGRNQIELEKTTLYFNTLSVFYGMATIKSAWYIHITLDMVGCGGVAGVSGEQRKLNLPSSALWTRHWTRTRTRSASSHKHTHKYPTHTLHHHEFLIELSLIRERFYAYDQSVWQIDKSRIKLIFGLGSGNNILLAHLSLLSRIQIEIECKKVYWAYEGLSACYSNWWWLVEWEWIPMCVHHASPWLR